MCVGREGGGGGGVVLLFAVATITFLSISVLSFRSFPSYIIYVALSVCEHYALWFFSACIC